VQRDCAIILGISGGISAYKVPSLIRLLKKNGCSVRVVLTEHARDLVGIETLRVLSNNPVYTDRQRHDDMEHIHLALWGSILTICPATANTIAKIAHGIADNLLTTCVLSFSGPIVVVPAMNTVMWNNPATQKNIDVLRERGISVLDVDEGELACGESGKGRMKGVEEIATYLLHCTTRRPLQGKRVLIASGPTMEPLDPVRVLTNRSSGTMGAELAAAAHAMGAEVTVVTGRSAVRIPDYIHSIPVTSADEMRAALEKEFPATDICIMAAAVSDFRPEHYSKQKIQRTSGATNPVVRLVPNADIAQTLGTQKKNQFLVCFSLETEPGTERARKKMKSKQCDIMIVNSQNTIGTDTTSVTVLFDNNTQEIQSGEMSKREAAAFILQHIARCVDSTNE
jgi:phosphopantothenoylcysteine decarboxylase/phosphopantothenate--cysteine ligase